MRLREVALYIASLIFFAIAIYAYIYESRYTGLLPIVTYPFRAFAIPLALIGLVLLASALVVRRFLHEAEKEASANATKRLTFPLAFLIAGFSMKIVGEAVHELLGHGFFALLFGGQVQHFYISLFWPYEFSFVSLNMPSASPDQMAWVAGGGILVSAVVSFSIQTLLLRKRLRWHFSVPLFWLSFWCFINATGYLIIGGVSPFGDVEELIRLGVFSSYLALVMGAGLFLAGFLVLSEILRETLTTVLKKETRREVLAFWFIIPALVWLTMAGRGIFHFLIVPFSFSPILLSYLLEFQIKRRRWRR